MSTTLAQRVAARYRRALSVGETFENEHWRIHRYATSIHATQLLNAGKRGKKVPTLVLVANGTLPLESIALEMIVHANRGADFARMKQVFDEQQDVWEKEADVYLRQDRGVDVTPAGFKVLKIKGQGVLVEVGYKDFSVRDLVDTNNEPTCIPAIEGGQKDIPVFYRWVKDNEQQIQHMTFQDVLDQMRSLGVRYHRYCAMD
jgi:hypothetical protein